MESPPLRHSLAVTPVTRGVRLASVLAVQSVVSDDGERRLLHDLNTAIRTLADQDADPTAVVVLTNIYHDLLRKWADA